jgi:hypothetical protein
MDMHKILARAVVGAALAAAGVSTSMGASVALSDTTTSAGTTAYGTDSVLVTPGSYSYANTFGGGSGGGSVSQTLTAGFYDDFVFTITGGSADSVTSTINLRNILEIDGLQVALFSYSAGQQVPVTGSPLAAGWSQTLSGGVGTVAVISPTDLAPGSYALEVAGTVTGTAGGSYSGTLNLAPVPLPAGLPLLLSGLGVLGFWGRRRLS